MKTQEQVLIEEIETLDKIKERGAISDEKYEKKKAKLTKLLEEENSPKGSFAKIFIGLMLMTPIIFIAWIFISSLSQSSNEKMPELDIKIRISNDKLVISNLGAPISDCQLTLNRDWHYKPLNVDGAIDLPYSQITKHNGERFNPSTNKPSSIIVDCEGYSVMEYN